MHSEQPVQRRVSISGMFHLSQPLYGVKLPSSFLIAFLSQKLEHRLHETQYSGSMLFFSALTSCEIACVGQVLEHLQRLRRLLEHLPDACDLARR